MTGRPQRELPKEIIRLTIFENVYWSLRSLYKNDSVKFTSMSQLVETIIFLSEHIYAIEPENGFILGLAKLRANQVVEQIKDPELHRSRFLHVSIDAQAIAFVDMLVSKYPMLFKNRSDVVDLLLWNVGRECDTEKGIRYYANRLSDVLLLHPTRKKSDA